MKRLAIGTMDSCRDAKTILVCFYFSDDNGEPLSGPIASMTPQEARELAQALVGTAEDIEAGRVLR